MDKKCGVSMGDQIVRFLLVQRESNHHTLFMRISHAQFDGTSLPLLYRALKVAYEDQKLPAVQWFSHSVHVLGKDNSQEDQAFWRKLLEGSSMTHILAQSGPSYKNIINDRVHQFIPHLSLQFHDITFATLIKAAWSFVLADLSGISDVVFGHVVSGRNIALPGTDEIFGPYKNVVPVRVSFDQISTVLSLLTLIQEQYLASMRHENLGLRTTIEGCTDWPG